MARPLPDRARTLDELEGQAWGAPEFDSHLVATCHRLRTKPIGQFTVEDLRILIGQRIGLPFLVPLALEVLEREPLAEGEYYPGDLLAAVLRAGHEFWLRECELAERVRGVVGQVVEVPPELVDDIREFERGCGRTTA